MHTRSRRVGIPRGLNLPLAFGIHTRLIGSGRFDLREVLPVHSRRALVRAALRIGVGQHVFPVDLVVQRIEAVAGFRLRFRV
jgi:hypothetical protein